MNETRALALMYFRIEGESIKCIALYISTVHPCNIE
jgi:hypothetical protein